MCLFSHRAPLLEVCKEPHCCSWYITRLLRRKIFSFYTSFVLLLCLMDFTDHKSLGTNGMHNYASCSLFFFFSLNRDKNLSVEAFQGCTYLHTQPCQEGLLPFKIHKKKSEFWLGREPFFTKQYGSLPCENKFKRFPIASSSGWKISSSVICCLDLDWKLMASFIFRYWMQ